MENIPVLIVTGENFFEIAHSLFLNAVNQCVNQAIQLAGLIQESVEVAILCSNVH